MLKVILNGKYLPTVIAVRKRDVFFTKRVILRDGDDSLVAVEELPNGFVRLQAKQNIIAVVSGTWDVPTGVDQVLFLRVGREKECAEMLRFELFPVQHPRLAKALHFLGMRPKPFKAGGIDALVYDDEIIVAYNSWGESGWVIKRVDVEKYLAAFDDARPEVIRVWRELRVDESGCESFEVLIEGWNEPPGKRDPSPCPCTEYTILYDRKSRIVRQIMLTNGDFQNIPVMRSPLRSIAIGKPLPANLAWR